MKNLKLISILAIAVIVIGSVSCKKLFNKEDKGEEPVITVLGPMEDFCWTPGPYNDPGATAKDAEDGDLTSEIEVINKLDFSQPGYQWQIQYKVTDKDGNEVLSNERIVKIVSMSGVYLTNGENGTCIHTWSSIKDTLTFTGHDKVTFSNVLAIPGASIVAAIQGDTLLTINAQTIAGNTFSGTGKIDYLNNGSGNLINIEIELTKTDGSGTNTCTYKLQKHGKESN